MFVGSWPRNHNTGRMFAHHAMGMFAEIAFSVVSIGLNYRHRNTKSKKMSQFLNFLPQNGLKITPYQLTQNAPNLTYSHLNFKNFPGGETPGPPPSKGAASRREGKGRRGGGGGEGRGSSGAFRGERPSPRIGRSNFCIKMLYF